MRGVKPEECRSDLVEWVRDMQERGIEICGAETGNSYSQWRCAQPVMSGSEHCYKHSSVESPLHRVNDADLRLAAEYFARGATGKQVADMLGLSPSQAYGLKKLATFPVVRKHKPELAPVDLEMVGIMKTGPHRWAELYGPSS